MLSCVFEEKEELMPNNLTYSSLTEPIIRKIRKQTFISQEREKTENEIIEAICNNDGAEVKMVSKGSPKTCIEKRRKFEPWGRVADERFFKLLHRERKFSALMNDFYQALQLEFKAKINELYEEPSCL